jgi:hypothetical protein
MYITDMTHFLDETGNIPKQMPKEARELAGFFALVIDAATLAFPANCLITEIKCFKKTCQGYITSGLTNANEEIRWKCNKCRNEGVINDWQGSKWDNNR